MLTWWTSRTIWLEMPAGFKSTMCLGQCYRHHIPPGHSYYFMIKECSSKSMSCDLNIKTFASCRKIQQSGRGAASEKVAHQIGFLMRQVAVAMNVAFDITNYHESISEANSPHQQQRHSCISSAHGECLNLSCRRQSGNARLSESVHYGCMFVLSRGSWHLAAATPSRCHAGPISSFTLACLSVFRMHWNLPIEDPHSPGSEEIGGSKWKHWCTAVACLHSKLSFLLSERQELSQNLQKPRPAETAGQCFWDEMMGDDQVMGWDHVRPLIQSVFQGLGYDEKLNGSRIIQKKVLQIAKACRGFWIFRMFCFA